MAAVDTSTPVADTAAANVAHRSPRLLNHAVTRCTARRLRPASGKPGLSAGSVVIANEKHPTVSLKVELLHELAELGDLSQPSPRDDAQAKATVLAPFVISSTTLAAPTMVVPLVTMSSVIARGLVQAPQSQTWPPLSTYSA